MKSVRRFALPILVVVAAVGLASHTVQAQPQRQLVRVDICSTAAADATVTLGPTATQVSSTSPNTSYSADGCLRYALNINVGQAQSVQHYANTFRLNGSIASPTVGTGGAATQQECTGMVVDISYYKKASGQTAFAKIGGGRLTGNWVPASMFAAHCELQTAAGFTDPGALSYPSSGTDTYRVAISAKVGAAFKTVMAGAGRTPQPS